MKTAAATKRTGFLQLTFALLVIVATAHAQSNDKSARHHSESAYQQWLDTDVAYIIAPEEKAAFSRLSQDSDRDHFIEQFWLRRDPDPGTLKNEFKEEHYRRIAYANEHFAAGVPGWRSDRGRIYILYGPPTGVDAHHTNDDSGPPTEIWHYRSNSREGRAVDFKFVDFCRCGAYRLQRDDGLPTAPAN